MCSQFWTLRGFIAPCRACGHVQDWELQTHFMGEIGSCLNYYRLGEPVTELAFYTGSLEGDPFVGDCESCKAFSDFGARIENGIVKEVFPVLLHTDGPSLR